ncbi:hypothetical protein JCM3765_007858 [Sporobolomyces pararoseus]
MLSSLPPELLLQIIESTVSHTFHARTYNNRQRTLCSLSLVSKQFCTLAQPLLYEMVWIKSRDSLERYKTTIGSFGESDGEAKKMWRPKAAVIESKVYFGETRIAEEEISKEAPQLFNSVKSLIWDLNNFTVEGFSSLNSFSNLSRLHLSRVWFDPVNAPGLPKLQSLTLYGVGGLLMASLIDPKVVPSLKHFSLVDDSARSAYPLKRSRIADLLPQLETLHFHVRISLHPELSFLHSVAERTLVDSNSREWNDLTGGAAQIVNLRLIDAYLNGTQNQNQNNIYLDSSLRPRPTLPPPISDSMDKLVVACRKRSIELVFVVVPKDSRLDNWISAEFVKRQMIRQNEMRSNRVASGGRNQQG